MVVWMIVASISFFAAGVCPVTSQAYGAVHLIFENSTTSLQFNNTGVVGEPASYPLTGFPGPCTMCDAEAPTEHCDYEEGFYVKLSDSEFSVWATNGSLLHRLNISCSPQYLHRLDDKSYAIVCHQSSYDIVRLGDNYSPELDGLLGYDGTDGILVLQVSNRNGYQQTYRYVAVPHELYITAYDRRGTPSYIFPDWNYIPGSLVVRPTFSSTGLFFVDSATDSDDQVYFLCSVSSHNCQKLDLCAAPVPSPPGAAGGETFTTTCDTTFTVYDTHNVSRNHSFSFDSSIVSSFPLDHNTWLVVMGSSQHIVSVNTFLKGNGSSGIVTLENTANCSLLNKLVAPDIYAMTCQNDLRYYIRLVNKTSGQSFGLIRALPEKPRDIFFEVQEPQPPSPLPTSSPTPITTGASSESPSLHPTFTSNLVTGVITSSTTTAQGTPPTNPPSRRTTTSFPANTVVIAAIVTGVALTILITILVTIFKFRAHNRFFTPTMLCKKKYPTPEEGGEDSNKSLAVCCPADLTSSFNSSQASSSSSLTTVAIPETCGPQSPSHT